MANARKIEEADDETLTNMHRLNIIFDANTLI
jgi:hypothetical protein